MKMGKILLILAILAFIGGFLLIMNGKLAGVLLLLAAFAIGVFSLMKARSNAGYDNEDVFFNGVGGTGRQQSEVSKKEKERI